MKTLKLRIKDKHAKVLNQLASEANFVWNYVNDLCFRHLQRTGQFFSAYDVAKYTKGASKECHLHSQTIQAITEELITRRKQFKGAGMRKHAAIFVGNVKSKALAKTTLAKSVLDASWATFKTMLRYKCENAGVWYEEVNESYTTQTCSCCGSISPNSPKGRAGLRIREWTCPRCGATHDRDINAAKDILAAGHCRLAAEIPVPLGRGGCQDKTFIATVTNL